MKPIKHKKTMIFLALLVFLFALSILPNFTIETTQYTLVNSKLPSSFDGFKIVQISDLHNENFGNKQSTLIDKVISQKPNLILITGDLIDSSHPNLDSVMDLIHGIKDLAPIYFVSGNHESWIDQSLYDSLKMNLSSAGVIILENQVIDFKNSANESIKILGLNENSSPSYALEFMMSQVEKTDFILLLAHHPENFELYVSYGLDLVFSGHAHGGQMRLPVIGGLIAPDQGILPKYTSGLWTQDKTTMCISRGLGNSIIPIRFFNGPELITLTLRTS
ncbi:MAG: metallophosphoesterase [Erysipelotrichaceae bacterium]|nr:metallophosphoesterase [Erysipelotrichaceae bacterium]